MLMQNGVDAIRGRKILYHNAHNPDSLFHKTCSFPNKKLPFQTERESSATKPPHTEVPFRSENLTVG